MVLAVQITPTQPIYADISTSLTVTPSNDRELIGNNLLLYAGEPG